MVEFVPLLASNIHELCCKTNIPCGRFPVFLILSLIFCYIFIPCRCNDCIICGLPILAGINTPGYILLPVDDDNEYS
eukprot:c10736_g1_i1 orf=186-416(+)